MPPIGQYSSTNASRILMIGDSGAGKTGSLAALAAAGYNIRILDFDNGVEVLAKLLTDPKSPYAKSALDRITYITLSEQFKSIGGKLLPTTARVWQNTINTLENWVDGEQKLGSVTTWTKRDVLVIDSLTFLSKAAMNYTLAMNAHLGQNPTQPEWGHAQNLVSGLLSWLTSPYVKCHVIIMAHITYQEDRTGGVEKAYPASLGRALSPTIGTYFNNVLLVSSRGGRKIHTAPIGLVEVKTASPLTVKKEYPLETGLAEFFKDLGLTPE